MRDAELFAMMREARDASGMPLDFWDELTEGLGYKATAILCGRSFLFPKYMYSRLTR